MDLSNYSREELFLSAIKSEVDSNDVYSKLADSVKNAFLKAKLKFLADEELKHRQFLETAFKNEFPDKEISLPDKTYVPLPELRITDELAPLSDVLDAAMTAEQAAQEFYSAFSEEYPKDSDVRKTLLYFADMELGHYKILEVEKENLLKYEAYDEYWPMMHIGT